MKKILYTLLLIPIGIFSQSIEDNFSKSLCECYNENTDDLKNDINLNYLSECFDYALKSNETEITEFVLKKIDTTKLEGDDAYKIGYSYGQKLFGNIQEKVVNECDSYFDYISNISSIMLDNMPKSNGQKDIDSLTKLIDKNPKNKALLWERGAYKIGVRDFKSAQSDFRLSIAQDSTFAPANFFLAWSYQLDGNSEKAIEEYQKTLSRSINLGAMEDISKMYLAYLKRKLRKSN